MKRLVDLNPQMTGNATGSRGYNTLTFDCPRCGPPYVIGIAVHMPEYHKVPAQIPAWTLHINGGWERSTLEPSIDNPNHGRRKACGWHGHITDGQVSDC